MEAIRIHGREYTVRTKKNGTLILTPIIDVTDKRAALEEYSDVELVEEMERRAERRLNDLQI